MEIEITDFFNLADAQDFSASCMERGDRAGPETWAAALEAFEDYNLLDTEEKQEAARAYFAEFGAWTREELAASTAQELNALLLQFITGDMREFSDAGPDDWDWQAYEAEAKAGRISGRLFSTDDGRVYFYIGN